MEYEDIEFLVQEIILYEIDDDSLDMACNRSYDESDRGITFIDLGESMSYYGATEENMRSVRKEIETKFKIDLSDIKFDSISISDLIENCYKRYR